MADATAPMQVPPGIQPVRRFRPRFHWELLVCGVSGHELIGTDAAELRPQDRVIAREIDSLRWYRCVRCDSWLPVGRPSGPTRTFPPERDEVQLPLRGRALRDKVVLRVIAVDRAFHFVVLAILSVAVLLFATHRVKLRAEFFRIANAVQGGSGGPAGSSHGGFFHSLQHVVTLKSSTLYAVALAAGAYAVLEGVEAVGLWYGKRWAEYLTFVATVVFIPYEIYELSHGLSPLKVVALVVNLAIAVYLLFAKRLFGLRGGGAAVERQRRRDIGWDALERTAP